jgi:tagatose-1,6-bisphosphate aldolase
MYDDIKNLVNSNKAKRETYIKEKHSEAFQTALHKIKNSLKLYDPSKDVLKIDISPFVDGDKNKELCAELIRHLKQNGIICEYLFQPDWNDHHDCMPERHYLVFNF